MSLADIQVAREEVPYNGTSFFVQGLTFHHITHALLTRKEEVLEIVQQFDEQTSGDQSERMAAFAPVLLSRFPDLIAELIAMAAGEPKQADKVKALPATVQIEAMIAVARLTFGDVASVKKFVDHLILTMHTATQVIDGSKTPSLTR